MRLNVEFVGPMASALNDAPFIEVRPMGVSVLVRAVKDAKEAVKGAVVALSPKQDRPVIRGNLSAQALSRINLTPGRFDVVPSAVKGYHRLVPAVNANEASVRTYVKRG